MGCCGKGRGGYLWGMVGVEFEGYGSLRWRLSDMILLSKGFVYHGGFEDYICGHWRLAGVGRWNLKDWGLLNITSKDGRR